MVDWKKDIKLSDLLARDKGDEATEDSKAFHEEQDPFEQEAEAQRLYQVEPARNEPTDAEPEEADVDDSETTPFWKREITFGRQKDESDSDPDFEVAGEDAEKRAFFKRGLGFRRAQDELDTEPDFDTPEEESKGTPFWKRERGFGSQGVESDSDPDFDAPDAAKQTPFWKRELSFGRQRGDSTEETSVDAVEPVDEQPEAADESGEHTPFWKRELGFGRQRDDSKTDPDFAPQPELKETPFWKRERGFGSQGVESDSDPDFDAPDAAKQTPFWKRELGFGRQREDSTEETPVAADDSTHEHEPAGVSVSEGDTADSTPFRTRELSFGPQQEESTEDTHGDLEEPAHEQLQPTAEADTTEGTPFWKRELSFGRRRDDDSTEEPAVDAEEFPQEPEPAAAVSETDTAEGTRFWKRQLSFGRAKDPDFDVPDAEKRPLFERALSFRRSQDGADVQPEDEGTKRSFFKRDFSLRRSTDPDLDAPEERYEAKPFFKRELNFRFGKRGTHEAAASRTAKSGRKKQLVGLKVGASQIAAARIVNNGSPELVQLARQPIEQGIVVGGELRDPEALADALREFFARHKLPNRNVRLGIGNNRIGVRSFEISGVHDPKQLENAIRFRAQETLPIPLDEAVLDYHVIDEAVSPTGIRTYHVLLVVAYRELIDRYVAACRGAGLRLVGIDLEAFALLRALSPPPSEGLPEDTALVAVAIGHDRSTFAVSTGTVCEFTRVLDWGGSSLNTAIARTLDVTPSQAEPVKRTLSLSEGREAAATGNEHTARAEEAVRLELQTFARELVSSLHFYQNQPGSLAIGTIVLTGGTAHLPGLAAELQRLIGVKVRVGDPLRRLKTAKRVETPDQVGSLAVAIGLGIED